MIHKKRILILTKHLRIGGAEISLLRLLRGLDLGAYSIEVKLVFHEVQFQTPLPEGVELTYIFPAQTEEAKEIIRRRPGWVYQTYITEQYDVEIAFLEGYPTSILSWSRNPASYKIAWIHADFMINHHSGNSYCSRDAEIAAYLKYDRIIFCSEAARAAFQTYMGGTVDKRQEVFLPMPESEELEALSSAYLPEERSPYFCTLSRLAPEKGVDRILYAAAHLKEEGYSFQCLIFGDGPLRRELEQKISEESLEDCVVLKGYLENPYPYLKKSKAYVCPSKSEALGLSVIEALMLSVPVIACESAGTAEALHNGERGILTPNSAEGLLGAMRSFLQSGLTRSGDQSNNCGDPPPL